MSRIPSTKLIRLCAAVSVGVATLSVPIARAADDPATASTQSGSSQEPRFRRFRSESDEPRRATTRPTNEISAAAPNETDGEWQNVAAFMKTHTPTWWDRFERMRDESPMRSRIARSVTDRFRELERVRNRDPEQYQREIEQLELEDKVLASFRSIRAADREGQPSDALKSELKERVGQLFDLRIRNVEVRLKRLADTLETEKQRVAAEKNDRQAAIDRNFESILLGDPSLLGPPGPRGRDPFDNGGPGRMRPPEDGRPPHPGDRRDDEPRDRGRDRGPGGARPSGPD